MAKRDIVALFQLAASEPDSAYAKRFVAEAREISKRTRTPIPRQFRLSFCRKCGTPWFGSQRRVRTRSSGKSRRRHIVFSCLVCGNARRIPLSVRRGQASRQQRT
ncbi:MAG: hypothetical protein ACE5OZ_00090 [Candidatus Heimdallarchaeota archaeon]